MLLCSVALAIIGYLTPTPVTAPVANDEELDITREEPIEKRLEWFDLDLVAAEPHATEDAANGNGSGAPDIRTTALPSFPSADTP